MRYALILITLACFKPTENQRLLCKELYRMAKNSADSTIVGIATAYGTTSYNCSEFNSPVEKP